MKIVKTESGNEFKIYSHPKEMPIGRYSDFLKYLAEEVEILSSLNKAKAFSEEDDKESCELEINNAIAAYLSLQKGVSMQSYAFAISVAEINGKQAKDTTVDGLDAVISELSTFGITQLDIESSNEELKKKSQMN